MSEWTTKTLKEITLKIGSGSTPTGGGESYKEYGISLVRSQNVLDFRFSKSGLAYIDEKQAYELRGVTLQQEDVLLNITGDSVARCCLLPTEVLPGRVNQHVSIIRANREKAVPKYLLYSLIYQKETLLTFSEIGATRRALTKAMLEDFQLLIPPLPEQEAIAEVLSSLDDKIDLLHRNNKTLEELAETLFRQWFVEEAEENWELSKLGGYITAVGGTTPDTTESKFWNGSIAWTSPRDLSGSSDVFMKSTTKTITEQGLAKIGSGLLPIGTVLLSSRAPIGYLSITNVPVAINQGYIACICDKGVSKWFIYCWIKKNMDLILSSANGSTFMEISKGVFRNLDFVVPPIEKLRQFDETVEPLFRKMLANELQIHSLENLRDILLPKLMSGEVRLLKK